MKDTALRHGPARHGSPSGLVGGLPNATSNEPSPPSPDVSEQIRELGKLRDEGLVTDDEFKTKKGCTPPTHEASGGTGTGSWHSTRATSQRRRASRSPALRRTARRVEALVTFRPTRRA